MDQLFFIVWSGLVAGIVHVYAGADHLAALMPISVGRRSKAAWLGARWGVGHSFGVLIVAVILLAARTTISFTAIGAWSERLVGVMLIAFGIFAFRTAYSDKFHLHEHAHGGTVHSHLHVHDTNDGHVTNIVPAHKHLHIHAALGAGTLHGVGGMAHLMGVLPSLAFATLYESFLYLAAFALGSILAMAGFAAAIGSITARLGIFAPRLISASMYLAAIACFLVGGAWLVAPVLGYELP